MIWDVRKHAIEIEELCEEYNVDYNKYKDVLDTIPYSILLSKFKYLEINGLPINASDVLHPFLTMTNLDMQAHYNISLEELLEKYGKERKSRK